MGGNRADAEDVLSEASLRACHAWSTKPPQLVNIKGWFVRLVQNHCSNVNKSRVRRTRVVQCVEDISTMAVEPAAEDAATSPEDVALRGELGQHIRHAIDDLPPRLQVPADLSIFSRMSTARTLPLASAYRLRMCASVFNRHARCCGLGYPRTWMAGSLRELFRLPPGAGFRQDKVLAG